MRCRSSVRASAHGGTGVGSPLSFDSLPGAPASDYQGCGQATPHRHAPASRGVPQRRRPCRYPPAPPAHAQATVAQSQPGTARPAPGRQPGLRSAGPTSMASPEAQGDSLLLFTGNIRRCDHQINQASTSQQTITAVDCTMRCWSRREKKEGEARPAVIRHPKLMEPVAAEDLGVIEVTTKLFLCDTIHPEAVSSAVSAGEISMVPARCPLHAARRPHAAHGPLGCD